MDAVNVTRLCDCARYMLAANVAGMTDTQLQEYVWESGDLFGLLLAKELRTRGLEVPSPIGRTGGESYWPVTG